MRLIRWPGPLAAALYGVGTVAVAGAVHGAAVLHAAHRPDSAAFRTVAAATTPNSAVVWNGATPFRDPAMARALCRYDLGAGPVRLTIAPFPDGFAAIGFHGKAGEPFFGLTVEAGEPSPIAVLLLTAEQQKDLADRDSDEGEEDSHDLQVVAPGREGFVLAETPAGAQPPTPQAQAMLKAVSCAPATPPGPPRDG